MLLKRRGEAFEPELRVLGEDLIFRRATSSQLDRELHTEARASNARIASENSRIGDDEFVCHTKREFIAKRAKRSA